MKFYSHETKWLVQDELDTIQSLGGIIKFINALNISQTNVVDRIYLKKEKGDYTLYVFYEGEPVAEEYQANRQKKHIEKILKDKLSINFTRA